MSTLCVICWWLGMPSSHGRFVSTAAESSKRTLLNSNLVQRIMAHLLALSAGSDSEADDVFHLACLWCSAGMEFVGKAVRGLFQGDQFFNGTTTKQVASNAAARDMVVSSEAAVCDGSPVNNSGSGSSSTSSSSSSSNQLFQVTWSDGEVEDGQKTCWWPSLATGAGQAREPGADATSCALKQVSAVVCQLRHVQQSAPAFQRTRTALCSTWPGHSSSSSSSSSSNSNSHLLNGLFII
jgi:hypothetical protein